MGTSVADGWLESSRPRSPPRSEHHPSPSFTLHRQQRWSSWLAQ